MIYFVMPNVNQDNIAKFSGQPEVGADVPYYPNIRKEKVDRPTYGSFWENQFF